MRIAGLAETCSAAPRDFQYQEMGSKKESLGALEPILKTGPLSVALRLISKPHFSDAEITSLINAVPRMEFASRKFYEAEAGK